MRVVRWQQAHGRHDLPWQAPSDPYRVWLSEVMLQQTQVATVLPYFDRFVQRWPTLPALARASLPQVMAAWSGLGYYRRARMLWECARLVQRDHNGVLPTTVEVLATLPGIGRSTAAAIASLCAGQRVPILDANVRRVLTRHAGLDRDGTTTTRLWTLATERLPRRNARTHMPTYTQGMMDLGALVCTARAPNCVGCPVRHDCQWRAPDANRTAQRPAKKAGGNQAKPSLHWWLLVAMRADGAVWLETRPSSGIWAGLMCAPCFDDEMQARMTVPTTSRGSIQALTPRAHELTHRKLLLHPLLVSVPQGASLGPGGRWVSQCAWHRAGLPAPVRALLLQCEASSSR